MTTLPPISARRRRTDVIMRWLMGVATVIALVPLVLVLYYLFHKGLSAWSADFFTTEVWTWRGLVTFYTVFVIDLASRRVHIVARRRIPMRGSCARSRVR